MAGKTRNYTEDFKKQIVALHGNGKTSIDLSKEYSIAKSTVTKWVRDYNNNGSFKAKDNRSEEDKDDMDFQYFEKIANIVGTNVKITVVYYKDEDRDSHKYI